MTLGRGPGDLRSCHGGPSENAAAALRDADRAMYAAKARAKALPGVPVPERDATARVQAADPIGIALRPA